MTRNSLIWIVVDSVRTYRTFADDRDRLDVMDEFGEKSVEFLNAYTSAPSSILSGAAMFTGMPCCFISRHFDAWQFDPNVIISLQNILADNGYVNFGIHNSKEDREVMKDLIFPISGKYFPKGISHGKWWTNQQMNQILQNILDTDVETPAFFMLWYDCREDPNVSDRVKEGLQIFKDKGLYENSVIVMCSDHGYPDPSTDFNKATMKETRHDMIVTDDNVRIPLFIKFPGCRPGKVIDTVGTVDLLPTILSLLEIKCDDPRMNNVKGYDLSDLLDGKMASWNDRFVRIDTRLRLAKGRVTALRSKRYKYVYYHDEKVEELYDLKSDPSEMKDLLQSPCTNSDVLRLEFRKVLDESQDELNEFHISELESAFERNVKKIGGNEIEKILLMSTAPFMFLNLLTSCFRQTFEGVSIDLLISDNGSLNREYQSLFDRIIRISAMNLSIVKEAKKRERLSRYDVGLVICENSSVGFDDPKLYRVAKTMAGRVYVVDYNMRFYNRLINLWTRPLRRFKHDRIFYKQEPLLIFRDLIYYMRMAVNYLLKKKLVSTPDMEKIKKMRDRAISAKNETLKA